MSPHPRGPSLAAMVVFSLLLGLYPRSIRTRFGAEMRQFFIDDYRACVGVGGWGASHFFLRSFWKVALDGIGARLHRPPAGQAGDPLAPSSSGGAREAVSDLGRTVRQTVRGLVRSPGFACTSVLTLGLGIGACTTIFSVTHPVLIAPLPYPEPEELASLYEKAPGAEGRRGWVSPLTYRDWVERTQHFEHLASWRLSVLTWTGAGAPRVVSGWAVSAGYFPLMGLEMTLGRGFTKDEDGPGASRVVILSHAFWVQHYGSDRNVLGQSMTLDGQSHTIVGIANPELDFPSGGDYWTPIGFDYGLERRDFRYLGVIGRLRQGSTLEDGRADLGRISGQVAQENPDTNAGWGAQVSGLKEAQVGSVRPILTGMTAAVALLLLISLGNVANLSLARSVGRQTESAVRVALGASRGYLARRSMVEGLMLSIVGSAIGVWIASGAIRLMSTTVLASVPRAEEIMVDGTTLVFAAGIALVVGLLLGLLSLAVPAGASLSDTLRAGGGGVTAPARAHRLREAVLATQVALALSLLIGAVLLTRSLIAMGGVDVGFDPEDVLTFSFDLPGTSYPDAESTRAFYRDALAAIGEIPGVEAAGAVTPMPMELGSAPSSWSLPTEVRPSAPTVMAHMRTATPGYFEAMRIPLTRGRAFDGGDQEDTQQVALVNEAFVRQYLGNLDPVGVRVHAGDADADRVEWITVVGVVGDVRFRSLRTIDGEPEIYLPNQQLPTGWGHLVVRAGGPREGTVRAVSAAVRSVDPELPLADVRTGEDIVGRQLTAARLSTTVSSVFAAAATALAVVGILGVLSIALAERVRGIGLRMVLGAPAGRIRRFALTRAVRPVVVGLALGLALSLAASRLLESQVFGVSALDPLTYALATMGFATAIFLACLAPSLRAASTDPLTLLRSD